MAEVIEGHAKADRGEQVLAVTVVLERSGLAHQRVDHMAILDAVFAFAAQPSHPIDAPLGIPHLQVFGEQAHLDPLADQPTVHRVGVVGDADRRSAGNGRLESFACFDPARRQATQNLKFLAQTLAAPGIELGEQFAHERAIVGPRGELAAPTQHQGLIQRPLEPVMALFDVAVLVGPPRLDLAAFEAVVAQ